MPATPKRISFDDIRVGDTIRVVDVRDIKVSEASPGCEIRDDAGGAVLRESRFRGATRTFQLIDRPIPMLPSNPGAVVKLLDESVWVLIYEPMMGGRQIWTNVSNGTRQSRAFMAARASTAGGFEVIR